MLQVASRSTKKYHPGSIRTIDMLSNVEIFDEFPDAVEYKRGLERKRDPILERELSTEKLN